MIFVRSLLHLGHAVEERGRAPMFEINAILFRPILRK